MLIFVETCRGYWRDTQIAVHLDTRSGKLCMGVDGVVGYRICLTSCDTEGPQFEPGSTHLFAAFCG